MTLITLINKKNLILAMCFVSFVSSVAFASFDVSDFDDDRCFGNAQNITFKRAMEGDEPLDRADKAFLAGVEEGRAGNRWRVKVLIGRPQARLGEIDFQVTSGTTSTTFSAPPTSHDLVQIWLGWGYKWTNWAVDLELLSGERLNYNNTSTVTAFPLTFSASARYLALFGNLEYEFPHFFDFIPDNVHFYVQGGGGIDVRASNDGFVATTTATRNVSHQSQAFAWNAGGGMRVEITPRLLADIAYRVIDLGHINFGELTGVSGDPFASISVKSKQFKSYGLFFGITYQL